MLIFVPDKRTWLYKQALGGRSQQTHTEFEDSRAFRGISSTAPKCACFRGTKLSALNQEAVDAVLQDIARLLFLYRQCSTQTAIIIKPINRTRG
jgi:hypothetical protein